ncbi:RHS repeat-associated protein (fragment) [Burkholderiales bacterium 8X]
MAQDRLASVNASGGRAVRYGYDSSGNLGTATAADGQARSYLYESIRYADGNALGQRVFKTEPQFPPSAGDEADNSFMQTLLGFFAQLWQPAASDAQRLGTVFTYDEQGSLIAETGTGGANSTQSVRHIYLPTAGGPMPIAAVVNGKRFAVSSDHLNTPRRITDEQGQVVWQWAYSAFGDDKPTQAANRFADPEVARNAGVTNVAALEYNKRYDGQYFDVESGLSYNYFRTYSSTTGRYIQPDPIGLDGGWSRVNFGYDNPLQWADSKGLNPVAFGLRGAVLGAGAGSAFGPPGTIAGGLVGTAIGAAAGWYVTGPMLQADGSARPSGAIDAIAGSKEWGRRNGVPDAVDIFHDIKRGNRGKPGSRAADNCSVDPRSGDIYDGQGEHIGNLGEGH